MARSKITSQGVQLQNDSGAVLFSLVEGEQLDYLITLNWLTDITGYEFEVVIMEGNNTGSGSPPSTPRVAGVNTTLTLAMPTDRGTWLSSNGYSENDIVLYNAVTYRKLVGVSEVNATLPNVDATWEVYVNNKFNIQFPMALTDTWTVKALPDKAVYGFIDMRITEPVPAVGLRKTFKPMQGLVEILFSPTHRV